MGLAGLPLPERPFVTARKASLSPWTGCDKNGEGCGVRMKEKERERRALLSGATVWDNTTSQNWQQIRGCVPGDWNAVLGCLLWTCSSKSQFVQHFVVDARRTDLLRHPFCTAVGHNVFKIVATFRVARLTLQTRKLCWVGVATDRNARYHLTCPNVSNL